VAVTLTPFRFGGSDKTAASSAEQSRIRRHRNFG
jgi:hypothetical protein